MSGTGSFIRASSIFGFSYKPNLIIAGTYLGNYTVIRAKAKNVPLPEPIPDSDSASASPHVSWAAPDYRPMCH
jgi:hypothetical protein